MLLKFAKEHTDIDLKVFCGHSHEGCEYRPLHNLKVYVGQAEYNQPCVQGIIGTHKFEINLVVSTATYF